MKQIVLPVPPNPDDNMYKNNPVAYNRAMFQWATHTKGLLEQQSNINNVPLDQPITLNSYTVQQTISGTTTGTALSNFVSTLAASMIRRGFISPYNRGGSA